MLSLPTVMCCYGSRAEKALVCLYAWLHNTGRGRLRIEMAEEKRMMKSTVQTEGMMKSWRRRDSSTERLRHTQLRYTFTSSKSYRSKAAPRQWSSVRQTKIWGCQKCQKLPHTFSTYWHTSTLNTDINRQIHILIPVLTYLGSLNQNNIGIMLTDIAFASTFCM